MRSKFPKKSFAKKSFGQNFLVDENYISRIISTLKPEAGETIIEIGAGRRTENLQPFDFDPGMRLADEDLLCGACLAERPRYARARAVFVYNDASRGLVLGLNTFMVFFVVLSELLLRLSTPWAFGLAAFVGACVHLGIAFRMGHKFSK